MDCKYAQSLVPQYIADKLAPRELEEFIRHVENCPECYDELETYFMLGAALKYLDDTQEVSYDLRTMLAEDLKEKKRRLSRRKRRTAGWIIFCAAGVLALVSAALDMAGIISLSFLKL